MKSFFISYLASLISLTVIDGIWLGLVMRSFYFEKLGHLFGSSVVALPAILFYVLYAGGITALVVLPRLGAAWYEVALYGALLGLVSYGAYDLTNHATLKEWPALVTVVDLAWGTYATAVAAVFSSVVTGWLCK